VSTRRDPLARREPLAPRAWNRIWAKGGTTDRVVRAVTGERGLAMLSLAALVVVGAQIMVKVTAVAVAARVVYWPVLIIL
jgi:hypothetical protein